MPPHPTAAETAARPPAGVSPAGCSPAAAAAAASTHAAAASAAAASNSARAARPRRGRRGRRGRRSGRLAPGLAARDARTRLPPPGSLPARLRPMPPPSRPADATPRSTSIMGLRRSSGCSRSAPPSPSRAGSSSSAPPTALLPRSDRRARSPPDLSRRSASAQPAAGCAGADPAVGCAAKPSSRSRLSASSPAHIANADVEPPTSSRSAARAPRPQLRRPRWPLAAAAAAPRARPSHRSPPAPRR